MKKKMSNDELLNQLQSVLSKRPLIIKKTCVSCGTQYAVDTSDDESELCLVCRVKSDMKLGDDVIINKNILNLWRAKRYNENGIDPVLCAVAEGVMLLPDIGDSRNHLSVISAKKVKIPDDKMADYIPKLIKRSNGKYDAIVFVRFQPNENFSIFTVRLSNRLVKILSKQTPIKIKTFCFSLVISYVKKQASLASRTSRKRGK